MIVNGNDKVGNARVYATQKEMDQENEITKLKAMLKEAAPWVKESYRANDPENMSAKNGAKLFSQERWMKEVGKIK